MLLGLSLGGNAVYDSISNKRDFYTLIATHAFSLFVLPQKGAEDLKPFSRLLIKLYKDEGFYNQSVNLAILEGECLEEVRASYHLPDDPQLLLFVSGKMTRLHDFDPSNGKEPVIEHLDRINQTISKELKSFEDVEKSLGEKKHISVYFGKAEYFSLFRKMAMDNLGFPFFHCFDESVAKKVFGRFRPKDKIPTEPIVSVLRLETTEFDPEHMVYVTGVYSKSTMRKFIENEKHPKLRGLQEDHSLTESMMKDDVKIFLMVARAGPAGVFKAAVKALPKRLGYALYTPEEFAGSSLQTTASEHKLQIKEEVPTLLFLNESMVLEKVEFNQELSKTKITDWVWEFYKSRNAIFQERTQRESEEAMKAYLQEHITEEDEIELEKLRLEDEAEIDFFAVDGDL